METIQWIGLGWLAFCLLYNWTREYEDRGSERDEALEPRDPEPEVACPPRSLPEKTWEYEVLVIRHPPGAAEALRARYAGPHIEEILPGIVRITA